MDEVLNHSERIAKEDLRQWKARSNGPGLVRLAIQLPLLIGSGVATTWLAAHDHPAWIGTVILCGAMLATFFPPLHEAGHRTAFRNNALNDLVTWFCGLLMLEAPAFFREFHWEHHRHTQDRSRDPEIAAAPWLLDGWPSNIVFYLVLVSGQHLLVGKAMFTISSALLPTAGAWEKLYPYVRPNMRSRVRWESWLVIALLGSFVYAGLRFVPGFAYLLLAWPISHVFLGFYLMPEHTGLANEGSQIQRTRTMRTNALVRFFMWNMPYHVEHHAYPAIPFHAVPDLHRRLEPELENVESGYISFHLKALRYAFTGAPRKT